MMGRKKIHNSWTGTKSFHNFYVFQFLEVAQKSSTFTDYDCFKVSYAAISAVIIRVFFVNKM